MEKERKRDRQTLKGRKGRKQRRKEERKKNRRNERQKERRTERHRRTKIGMYAVAVNSAGERQVNLRCA